MVKWVHLRGDTLYQSKCLICLEGKVSITLQSVRSQIDLKKAKIVKHFELNVLAAALFMAQTMGLTKFFFCYLLEIDFEIDFVLP